MNMVKLSHVPIIIAGMKEVMLERNPIDVLKMVKPLKVTVILNNLKEFILEKTL